MADHELEIKSCAAEFKASGDKGEYDGHFAVFGNVDDGGDISLPGMFLKTIAERGPRVKVFYGHDWSKVLGPAPRLLEEDAVGLHAAGRLTVKSFWGNEVWELMKDNAINEGSFGYATIKADYTEEGWRQLKEVVLYEISPVALGMNPLTTVNAVKGLIGRSGAIRAHSISGKKEFPILGVDREFDAKGIAEKADGNPATLRTIFAWFSGDDPADSKSYRLPHHDLNGNLSTRGLLFAGEAIARNAHDIPFNDLPLVKSHLAEHFEQLGIQPPWVDNDSTSLRTAMTIMEGFAKDLRDGKMLITLDNDSRKNLLSLAGDIIEAIEEKSEAAEPPTEDNQEHSALQGKIDARIQQIRLNLLSL